MCARMLRQRRSPAALKRSATRGKSGLAAEARFPVHLTYTRQKRIKLPRATNTLFAASYRTSLMLSAIRSAIL